MKEEEKQAFNNLVSTVQKQEETIARLIQVIAATNRRLTKLHKMKNNRYSL